RSAVGRPRKWYGAALLAATAGPAPPVASARQAQANMPATSVLPRRIVALIRSPRAVTTGRWGSDDAPLARERERGNQGARMLPRSAIAAEERDGHAREDDRSSREDDRDPEQTRGVRHGRAGAEQRDTGEAKDGDRQHDQGERHQVDGQPRVAPRAWRVAG